MVSHDRKLCATPIADGWSYSTPSRMAMFIEERLVDFIRMHISAMGGITPARNHASMQYLGIRTASHGPATPRLLVTLRTCTLTYGT